ncbi:3-oxoacyl-reductase [Atractiella rhizophila]|nr:3-oxoacyl-reductase [Atractiella rhizophila]
MGKLEGEVAIVTGGAIGLGAGIVTKFLNEGAKVIIIDWNIEPLKDDKREDVAVSLFPSSPSGDVSDPKPWEEALKTANEKWGKLTIVVNNAGIVMNATPTHEMGFDTLDRLLKVNLKPIFVSAQLLVPHFIKEGIKANFVNITSMSASRPRPGLAYYTASKAAAEGATKSLAIEYAPHQIRFNGVAPVIANTQMTNSLTGGKDDPEARKRLAQTIPIQRIAQPEDIANMVAHLACKESDFVTGIIVSVDGGRGI